MQRLFALGIFISATLLFLVQPLVGKILLPILGGSPSVWSTCLVFFQAVLLLGYLYAHALSTRVPLQWQWSIHAVVLLAASAMLPLPIEIGEPTGSNPRWWLIRALGVTVGLPFFALSATAPLLQRWFSRTNDPNANDPYFLYAASNAGSLLGLLGYLVVEATATRSHQARGWSFAFWSAAALIVVCAYVGRQHEVRTTTSAGTGSRTRTGTRTGTRSWNPEPGTRNRGLWIVLALVPSAMLLGVTQHLGTDVVSVPLLWVIPLAIYLTTFIVAFSSPRQAHGRHERTRGAAPRPRSADWWGAVAPWAVLLILVLSLAEVRYPIVPIALAHLLAFFALAMLCHTRLAEMRPDPVHLTEYFLCVSVGGVVGGAIVALVAPAVFSSILEYPIAIGAALLLRPQSAHGNTMMRAAAAPLFLGGYWAVSGFNERAGVDVHPLFRALLAVPVVMLLLTRKTALLFAGTAAGLLAGASVVRTGGDVLHRERTFYGVHEVTSQQDGAWHVLTHGTTTHGVQAFRGKLRLLPSAYYHPTGPIGDVVFTLSPEGRLRDVAVIGLGAGALAGYAGDGVRMDFFEVDEAVIRIAENPNYFTYLTDARARTGATVKTTAIDGRLGLRARPQAFYDVIVVDAFSSDAIPTHLITREAVAMYLSRLKPRGVLAFHVSNRFFDLGPVLAKIADDQQLVCYARNDHDVPRERAAEGKRPSVWVVIARNLEALGQIAHAAPRWVRVSNLEGSLWTDDFTNVLGALQGW